MGGAFGMKEGGTIRVAALGQEGTFAAGISVGEALKALLPASQAGEAPGAERKAGSRRLPFAAYLPRRGGQARI